MNRCVPAALLALLLLASCGEDEQGPVRIPDEYYGVAGHVLRLMAGNGQLERLDRHLEQVERLDLAFVRANLDWLQLEPNAPAGGKRSYEFRTHDDWMEALARHRLRWYVIGLGTPPWAADQEARTAGCSIFSPPADPRDFADLMEAVAERYGRNGDFWGEHPDLPYRPVLDYEIWNEPNLGGFWCPNPDPARYAELHLAAAAAIRGIDPDARVVLGGLAPFRDSVTATPGRGARMAVPEFLEAAIAAAPDLGQAVDIVGVHAYGDIATILEQVRWYRDTLADAGLGSAPMSVNEIGWPTQGKGGFASLSEPARAAALMQVSKAIARSDCGVSSYAPHTWVSDERDPGSQADWFGIADPATGAPYPTAGGYGGVVADLPPGFEVPPAEVAPLCGG